MSLTSKITCLGVLLSCFLLILATGRSNIRNFEKVQNSIEEIYKDRLVVKDLIFKLSSLLHEKELAIASNNLNFFAKNNSSVNKKIDDYLQAFRSTKLTVKEKSTLNYFSKNIEQLKKIEQEIKLSEQIILSGENYTKLKSKIKNLKEDLKVLSDIQLEEGQHKLKTSSYAVEQMNEFESLEIAALLIIGVMMAAVIFLIKSGKSI